MNLDVMAAFCAPKTRINKVCLPQVRLRGGQSLLACMVGKVEKTHLVAPALHPLLGVPFPLLHPASSYCPAGGLGHLL